MLPNWMHRLIVAIRGAVGNYRSLGRAVVAAGMLLTSLSAVAYGQDTPAPPEESPFAPRRYVAYRTAAPLRIDGRLAEAAWQAAIWTADFVHVLSTERSAPRFRTQVKMLWGKEYFYVAARLEDPHVWGTLTARDAVLFHDDVFEAFIDPDGDTHAYYELEVNALETVWDLMLLKPYRDDGSPVNAWDIRGLKVAVSVDGTLNQPGDRDQGWTVEIAVPWSVLDEAAPDGRPPRGGEQWRVNFSRYDWRTSVENGAYRKQVDPETGRPLPAYIWAWSPQGTVEVNIHRPEWWGYVQWSEIVAGRGTEAFVEHPNERVKWALRRLYYRQRAFREANGHYATRLGPLDAGEIAVEGLDTFRPRLWSDGNVYVLSAPGFESSTVYLRSDGKVLIE